MNCFFLIPSSTIRTSTPKKIKSVVGGQERVDVFSRILLNLCRWKEKYTAKLVIVFYLSHPEENLTFTIPLDLISSNIETELEANKFMINLLNSPDELGINTEKQDFSTLLSKLASDCKLFYLTSSGKDLTQLDEDFTNSSNLCFILGSQMDLTDTQEENLSKFDPTLISVGDREYLASHVVSIINHYLFTKFQ